MLMSYADHGHPQDFDAALTQGAAEQDSGWMVSFVDILMLLLTLFVLLLAYHATQQPQAAAEPATEATAERVTKTAASAAPRTEPVAPLEWASIATVAAGPLTTTATVHDVEPKPLPAPLFALTEPLAAEALLMALAAEKPAPVTVPAPPPLEIPPEVSDRVEVASSADAVNLNIKDEVLFDRASADLKPDAHLILDDIVALLSGNRYAVSVEGHTDDTPIETARYPSNWDLSVARATHVTRYLIEHGIDRQRLRAVGYADTRPLETTSTAEARARNRRVSLVVHLRRPEAETMDRQARSLPRLPASNQGG